MFGISGSEWIFILLVVLLLFGGRKIPELARSLGKGVSEFKKGVREIESESQSVDQAQPPAQGQQQAAPAQPYRFDPYTGKPVNETAPKG